MTDIMTVTDPICSETSSIAISPVTTPVDVAVKSKVNVLLMLISTSALYHLLPRLPDLENRAVGLPPLGYNSYSTV